MRLRLLSTAFLSFSLPAFAQEAPPPAEAGPTGEPGLVAAEAPGAAPIDPEPVSGEAPAPSQGAVPFAAPSAAQEDTGPEPVVITDSKTEEKITFTGAPGEGFTLKSGDKFSLNVRSRIQLRYQFTSTQNSDGTREEEQVANVSTLRLWFGGNLFTPDLTYLVQLALADRDYRDGAKSPVYDAYIEYKAVRDLNFRVGQYFVPFDRLRTVREWGLQMTERPRPVAEFTLDRDVGVTIFSDSFLGDNSPLAYRLGVFGGGGTNLSTGKEPGALFVGRFEVRPLGKIDDDKEGDQDRRAKPGLTLGGAVAANLNTNRQRSTTGATFVGGTTDYLHAAADLTFKWMGFALQAEYLWKQASADTIESTTPDGPLTEYTRSGQGWVLQASYAFDPPIEIVSRLSRIYAFEGTDPSLVTEVANKGQEFGAGLNYYFNGHKFKLQGDYIARMPTNFDFALADQGGRVQLDVTF